MHFLAVHNSTLEVIRDIIALQNTLSSTEVKLFILIVLGQHARPHMTCYKLDKAIEWALEGAHFRALSYTYILVELIIIHDVTILCQFACVDVDIDV